MLGNIPLTTHRHYQGEDQLEILECLLQKKAVGVKMAISLRVALTGRRRRLGQSIDTACTG